MNYIAHKKSIINNVKQKIYQNVSDVLYPSRHFENILLNKLSFDGSALVYNNGSEYIELLLGEENDLSTNEYKTLFHLWGFNISTEAIDLILATDGWATTQLTYYDGIEYGLKKYLVTICAYYSEYSAVKFNFPELILDNYAIEGKFFTHTAPDGKNIFYNPFAPRFNRTENWILEIDYAIKFDNSHKIDNLFELNDLESID
jgi:hypothetical protein